MKIRSLTEADYSQSLPMLQALHNLHVKQFPEIFGMTAEALPMEEFHSYLRGDIIYSVAAEAENGVLQGICLAERREKTSEDPRWCSREFMYIKALYVSEVFRGSGIGRALAEEVARRAHTSGIDRVELDVMMMADGAFGFYRRIGFLPRASSMTYRWNEKNEEEKLI